MTRIDINNLTATFNSLDPKHQAIIAELTYSLAQTTHAPPPTVDIAEYITPWIEHLLNMGKSPKTTTIYSRHVTRFLKEFPNPTPLDIDFHLTLRRNKVSQSNLAQFTQALRSLLSYLNQRGINTMNPADIPHIAAPRRRRASPPSENVVKLLSHPNLKLRSKALLYLLIDSGPRISEVLSLRRIDCDLPQLQIHITKAKGNKQRTIPISPTTAEILTAYLKTHNSNYLFPGTRRLTWCPVAVEQHMKRLCKDVGIPPITPHYLRHFFATQSINAGANIRSISEILGHENPSVTMNVYCHTNPELNAKEHADHSPLSKIIGKESK